MKVTFEELLVELDRRGRVRLETQGLPTKAELFELFGLMGPLKNEDLREIMETVWAVVVAYTDVQDAVDQGCQLRVASRHDAADTADEHVKQPPRLRLIRPIPTENEENRIS
jgi:hypothetical protein